MTELDLTREILDLMKIRTERDLQVKVGASNISTPCTRCLADDLLGVREEDQPYWLGAWEGTAVHERIEKLVNKHRPTWLSEQRLTLGFVPGYGEVKSTTDLYLPPWALVGDIKTTTRDKLVFIKRAVYDQPDEFEVTKVTEARFKVSQYLNQLFLYGMGMLNAGYPVEKVALIFVCRDGVSDKDVWTHTIDYDPEQAQKVWDRLLELWEWLQGGGDPSLLPSHDMCYFCNNRRDWSK